MNIILQLYYNALKMSQAVSRDQNVLEILIQ